MKVSKIISSKPLGIQDSLDFEVEHKDHNFIADGVVVSNSHAMAYGVMAALTIYLKINHTPQFYCALLRMSVHEQNPFEAISKITQELPHFDIKLLPPSLAGDNQDFCIEGKDIRFGLSAIKGMPEKALEKIRIFKGEYPTKISMFKAVSEAGVGIAATSALIMAGLLDDFVKYKFKDKEKVSRPRGVFEAQIWNLFTDKEKKIVEILLPEYGGDIARTYKGIYEEKRVDEKGKPYIPEKRYGTFKKNADKYVKLYNVNKENTDLCDWFFERKLLGFSYSKSLYNVMNERYDDLTNPEFFHSYDNGDTFLIAGIVTEIDETKSKKGDKMLRIVIQDNYSTIKCIFYGDKYVKWKEQQQAHDKNFKISEDDIILVKGQKKDDCMFLQTIFLVEERVLMKSSQIRMKIDEEEVKNENKPTPQ